MTGSGGIHPTARVKSTSADVKALGEVHPEAMPGRGTSMHSFRLGDETWDRFGEASKRKGTTRVAAIREFIRWYIGYPGAELPERPRDPS